MSTPPSFSIAASNTPDQAFETRFRQGVTEYEDTPDELPASQFTEVLKTAKSSLYTEFGITDFYSEHELSEALLYTTAIKAKIQFENYSVDSWSVGDESIRVRDADQSESSQMREWNEEVNRNLDKSDKVDYSAETLNWAQTANYNW